MMRFPITLPMSAPGAPGRRVPVAALAGLLLPLFLAGCVAYAPGALPAGSTAEALHQRMGEPTARHALPDGGIRLEYARGPAGLHTYMIDLDAAGRVLGWRQVLDEAGFAAVRPGLSREEVRRLLGTPTQEQVFERLDQRVWSYRWASWDCTWFQVTFGLASDRVRETGSGPDPRCDVPDDQPS